MKVDFNYLTKSERRGTLVFVVLIMAILLGSFLWRLYSPGLFNSSSKEEKLVTILQEEGIVDLIDISKEHVNPPSPKVVNPNTATTEELQAIGMTQYAAKSLIGLRKFRTIYGDKDMLEAYGIDSSSLAPIKPWLIYEAKPQKFQPEKSKPKPKSSKSKTYSTTPINPNSASLKELEDIGFSTFSASNIIKMRNAGTIFRDIEKIKKIYGVDKTTLEQVTPLLYFEDTSIDKTPDDTRDTITNSIGNNYVASLTFNPNTATYKELTAQGISPKVARTIIKFRKGEDTFKNPEDLLNVYGFKQSLLDSLRSRIDIPTIEHTEIEKTVEISLVDLSKTTAEELIKIKGIGNYYAKAIIKYRDALGGYHNVSQLQEVPAMNEELYEQIKSRFIISGKIRKFIPISMEFKQALKHPYMDYETTKVFFNLSANDYNKELDKLIKKGMVDTRLIPYLLAD